MHQLVARVKLNDAFCDDSDVFSCLEHVITRPTPSSDRAVRLLITVATRYLATFGRSISDLECPKAVRPSTKRSFLQVPEESAALGSAQQLQNS